MMSFGRRKREYGFSLVELMASSAIVGILAAVALPAFEKYIRRTRITKGLMVLRAI
jgi:prepilin-type N-terminal cleavage/methylation domain-containing protein